MTLTFIVVIGSNFEDRLGHVRIGLDFIRTNYCIISESEIYESRDCLGTGRKYLNAVVKFVADVNAADLMLRFKELERICGRTDEARKRGEVSLDIDIVLCNGEILREEDFNAAYFQRGYRELE